MSDISGIIKSTGVALEREALKQFGAAVGGATAGALDSIFGSPYRDPTGVSANPTTQEPGVWDTTRYAAALVRPDQVDFNPKLKFLFKVSFKFDPRMIEAASALGYDLRTIEQNASFMVRQIDRPKVDYEYEEVNLYNFRTKVLKQIRHRELGFTLYDDIGNHVLNFVNVYRKLQSPIARIKHGSGVPLSDHGMDFDTSLMATDTAIRGILPGGAINILQSLTIHQFYVERGAGTLNPSAWVKTVDFTLLNPRFTNIDIDDMDHENGSNFNMVTFTTDFDALHMSEPQQFTQSMSPSFPTGDVPANGAQGATNAAGGTRNPLVDILINQGARIARQGVSNIINKTLSTTAGGAVFAGELGPITSVIGDAARRTLGGLGSFTPGFSPVAAPMVSDDSVPPSQINNLST